MFSIDELNGVMRMKGENRVVQFHKHHFDLCDLNEFDKKNLELFENYREYLNHFANCIYGPVGGRGFWHVRHVDPVAGRGRGVANTFQAYWP